MAKSIADYVKELKPEVMVRITYSRDGHFHTVDGNYYPIFKSPLEDIKIFGAIFITNSWIEPYKHVEVCKKIYINEIENIDFLMPFMFYDSGKAPRNRLKLPPEIEKKYKESE